MNKMVFTNKQKAEFNKLTLDLIKWLDKNCHPHVTVVIDSRSAEALEGFECVTLKKEQMKDE